MTELARALLWWTLFTPVALLAATFLLRAPGRLRAAALGAAAVSTVSAAALLATGAWLETHGGFSGAVLAAGWDSKALLRVDSLSLPLFAMAGLVWSCGMAIAPQRTFSFASVRRSSLAYLSLVLAFSTEVPLFLAGMVLVNSAVFLLEHRRLQPVLSVAGAYVMLSVVLIGAGATFMSFGAPFAAPAIWLVLGGIAIRKGIVPGHSWIPDVFEHGRLVPTLLFNAPQLGTYAAVVLVLPDAPSGALTALAVLALATTLYGAVLASVQTDTRRAFGYLFMSQSALVLVGLGSQVEEGVAGSLAVWIAAGLSMTGLGLTVAALELRRGRLSLREHHGGYEQMPLLAASFLVFGLASVGFPGTLGFLGQELLVGGSVERFAWIGFVVVAGVALNGVTILKMYFSLFCGEPNVGLKLALLRRETLAFAALAVVLVVAGLVPKPLVDSRTAAAEAIMSEPRASEIAAAQ